MLELLCSAPDPDGACSHPSSRRLDPVRTNRIRPSPSFLPPEPASGRRIPSRHQPPWAAPPCPRSRSRRARRPSAAQPWRASEIRPSSLPLTAPQPTSQPAPRPMARDCFFSIEFRKRSECEDSFDYVGLSTSQIRSSSQRDLRGCATKQRFRICMYMMLATTLSNMYNQFWINCRQHKVLKAMRHGRYQMIMDWNCNVLMF